MGFPYVLPGALVVIPVESRDGIIQTQSVQYCVGKGIIDGNEYVRNGEDDSDDDDIFNF
jgi:hypothetical protein